MKGLDFALLNKVRAELNKQKKVEEVQSLDEFPASRTRGKGDEITGNPMLPKDRFTKFVMKKRTGLTKGYNFTPK